jgi:hypothetical protein
MIIGACGYGGTGSSAVSDLLREFQGIQIFDKTEFTYTYKVDGIQDLEFHLMKHHSKNSSGDYAIHRFLFTSKYVLTPFQTHSISPKQFLDITNRYIDSIVQLKYKGHDYIDTHSGHYIKNALFLSLRKYILPYIENATHNQWTRYPYRQMYVSVEPEKFYENTKIYIRNILSAMGADINGTIVLDQPFEGNSPESSFRFFDDPKAIVVDRDPRDLYLEAKYLGKAGGRFICSNNAQDFVTWYRNIRKGQIRKDTDRILFIRFEDLIYNYDNSLSKIKNFLGLNSHTKPKQWFNPERSICNTQASKRFPNDIDDVHYIEDNLKEYLFPFQDYPDVHITGIPFINSAKFDKK